jgi:hypothetical protein
MLRHANVFVDTKWSDQYASDSSGRVHINVPECVNTLLSKQQCFNDRSIVEKYTYVLCGDARSK